MGYILKHAYEAKRLNTQSSNIMYSPQEELKFIDLRDGTAVLDAGCGSGIFLKKLKEANPSLKLEGCDIDDAQLRFARENISNNINLYKQDLVNEKIVKKYDHIFNRYVAQHFKEECYRKILSNFKNCLNFDGVLTIIDADGVLKNIGTLNEGLRNSLLKIRSAFSGDLELAPKLPQILKSLGFKNIRWNIIVMDFQGKNRDFEINQWQQRLEFGHEFYAQALGSEFEVRKFKKLFLEEISKSNTPLFYNKFIINCNL